MLGDRGGRRWNLDGRSSNFTSEEEEEDGGEELLIGGIQEFSSSGLSKIELPEIRLCKCDFLEYFPLSTFFLPVEGAMTTIVPRNQ